MILELLQHFIFLLLSNILAFMNSARGYLSIFLYNLRFNLSFITAIIIIGPTFSTAAYLKQGFCWIHCNFGLVDVNGVLIPFVESLLTGFCIKLLMFIVFLALYTSMMEMLLRSICGWNKFDTSCALSFCEVIFHNITKIKCVLTAASMLFILHLVSYHLVKDKNYLMSS